MAPVTCMLRVCTYSCAVIDCVVWDFVFKFLGVDIIRTVRGEDNIQLATASDVKQIDVKLELLFNTVSNPFTTE